MLHVFFAVAIDVVKSQQNLPLQAENPSPPFIEVDFRVQLVSLHVHLWMLCRAVAGSRVCLLFCSLRGNVRGSCRLIMLSQYEG